MILVDEYCSYEWDENGLGFYGWCFEEVKWVWEKVEMKVKFWWDELRMLWRWRFFSMMNFRFRNNEDEMFVGRRRFYLLWGFISVLLDINVEEMGGIVENIGRNFLSFILRC